SVPRLADLNRRTLARSHGCSGHEVHTEGAGDIALFGYLGRPEVVECTERHVRDHATLLVIEQRRQCPAAHVNRRVQIAGPVRIVVADYTIHRIVYRKTRRGDVQRPSWRTGTRSGEIDRMSRRILQIRARGHAAANVPQSAKCEGATNRRGRLRL